MLGVRAEQPTLPQHRHPTDGHDHCFDSTVEVGRGEAAYADADAAPATPDETKAALQALNARLPQHKRLDSADLQPHGSLVVYRAGLRHRYLLVRGGNAEFGNDLDMTVEV